MARKVTEHLSIPLPPEHVAAQAAHVLRTLPRVGMVSVPGPVMTATTGVGMSSWGERIELHLAHGPDGGTAATVTSSSALPTQFIDWGRNRKNVATIIAGLTPQAPQPPQTPPAPGPSGRPHG